MIYYVKAVEKSMNTENGKEIYEILADFLKIRQT